MIIMAALIPIYSFQRVEGRIFMPMAYTYAFALSGALFFSFTVVLALAALLIKRAPREEREHWFFVTDRRAIEPLVAQAIRFRSLVIAGMRALLFLAALLLPRLGPEFHPKLNRVNLH